tara:strand:+ start:1025 stop:1204 length:180 start_codon:yes stop_codon:yes gene_type:complete
MKKQIDPLQITLRYMAEATLPQLITLEVVLSAHLKKKQEEHDEKRRKTRSVPLQIKHFS